ncbi:MAG: homocysteine S-methyltransferase family protein [Candidatus Kapaibacterium sp.]
MTFREIFESGETILTEGSIIEYIRRKTDVMLHPVLLNSALVGDYDGERLLRRIWNEYIDPAEEFDLPIILLTPTWRANRLNVANCADFEEINTRASEFLQSLRKDRGSFADKIFIGGLMGPRGDAYDPSEAMPEDDAAEFHCWQASRLARSGVDFLMASTLPETGEAAGIARAMESTGKDYVVSFVALKTGKLPGGNTLSAAMDYIDSAVDRKPYIYMLNCVHPENAASAIGNDPASEGRIAGIQGNASPLDPQELDNASVLHATDPGQWVDEMYDFGNKYDIKILGGCCGTDPRFIRQLAKRIRNVR